MNYQPRIAKRHNYFDDYILRQQKGMKVSFKGAVARLEDPLSWIRNTNSNSDPHQP